MHKQLQNWHGVQYPLKHKGYHGEIGNLRVWYKHSYQELMKQLNVLDLHVAYSYAAFLFETEIQVWSWNYVSQVKLKICLKGKLIRGFVTVQL